MFVPENLKAFQLFIRNPILYFEYIDLDIVVWKGKLIVKCVCDMIKFIKFSLWIGYVIGNHTGIINISQCRCTYILIAVLFSIEYTIFFLFVYSICGDSIRKKKTFCPDKLSLLPFSREFHFPSIYKKKLVTFFRKYDQFIQPLLSCVPNFSASSEQFLIYFFAKFFKKYRYDDFQSFSHYLEFFCKIFAHYLKLVFTSSTFILRRENLCEIWFFSS